MESATRRRFIAYFSSVGLASTLLPGILWAKIQEARAARVTLQMLREALGIAGLTFSEADQQQMLEGVNRNLERYEDLRGITIEDTVAPPLYFSPVVPGMRRDRERKPFRPSRAPVVRRPAHLEDAAFWPLAHLARLVETRQVTSVELTTMALERLNRYNPTLNCIVTLTEDVALNQARSADEAIAAGEYRGPLHGLPWGCKDILAVRGYPTTWGSDAFREQKIEEEATVVRLLREAGAVLVAKLTTGELAAGDRWFGGRTNNPWAPSEGSSGSSAGPAAATAAGLVAFGIGTETSGSILSPATVCGVTGLRPTFGRVSRHGCMTLSWSQDRIGPLCRTVEDCALVLHAIAGPDDRDLSVVDLPFNWDAGLDVRTLRVGYLEPAFREEGREADWQRNDERVLDQLRELGVDPQPFGLPAMPLNVLTGILGAESGAFFDAFLRSGGDQKLTSRTRGNGFRQSRLVPAVEYLQAQRVRAMVMRQLADAVTPFDVYVAPYISMRGSRSTDPPAAPRAERPPERPSAIRDHFQAANVCGYPAVAVPNGFTADGRPTSITFLGQPYADAEVLALARAYQEAAGWHKRHPKLDAATALRL